MSIPANARVWRAVYRFEMINNPDIPIYIGSTATRNFAKNHRQARAKGYKMSPIRLHIEKYDHDDRANEHIKPFIMKQGMYTQREIEEIEGKLIRILKPKFNKDMDPVASSIRYGRYDANV